MELRKGALEGMDLSRSFWKGKRVFITGHTGFKGAWLSLWLQNLGARLTGLSLGAPTHPSLFELLRLKKGMDSYKGDIRRIADVEKALKASKPEIVFHLAAQALVRPSYQDPLGTYATNVMGTLNLLEAVRERGGVRVMVNVTSDKCYENREWNRGYREENAMGGFDPYSSSKGCSELVTSAYRRSYFSNGRGGKSLALASARAGNVIGGGDWALDRLIPDLIRGVMEKKSVSLRNPKSVRPWQHVLEPLSGYLILAEHLWKKGKNFAEAWNFGPSMKETISVQGVVKEASKYFEDRLDVRIKKENNLHEARLLKLDCSKSHHRLKWRPKFSAKEAVGWTMAWYKEYLEGDGDLKGFTENQIAAYEKRGALV